METRKYMGKNSFALVTGASTGIGQKVAIEFGKFGYSVGLVARSKEKLLKTKELVGAAGGVGVVLSCDLSDPANISKLTAQIEKVDILVNVAGIWHGENEAYAGKDFETFSQKVILDTVNVGLIAPTLLVRELVPKMTPGSSVINISGTFENGAKGWLPYYVSKRGIEDLTTGLAQELADKKIKVNCVSPSDVATEQYQKYFPEFAKEAMAPEEVAKFVVELSQKEVTGKVFVLKKGQEPFEKFHS